MANEVQDLGTTVNDTVGVEASAGALIEGFAAYVTAHVNDPIALRSYVNQLTAAKNDLATKVAANPVPEDAAP